MLLVTALPSYANCPLTGRRLHYHKNSYKNLYVSQTKGYTANVTYIWD